MNTIIYLKDIEDISIGKIKQFVFKYFLEIACLASKPT